MKYEMNIPSSKKGNRFPLSWEYAENKMFRKNIKFFLPYFFFSFFFLLFFFFFFNLLQKWVVL